MKSRRVSVASVVQQWHVHCVLNDGRIILKMAANPNQQAERMDQRVKRGHVVGFGAPQGLLETFAYKSLCVSICELFQLIKWNFFDSIVENDFLILTSEQSKLMVWGPGRFEINKSRIVWVWNINLYFKK